jgi:hypothetical protein
VGDRHRVARSDAQRLDDLLRVRGVGHDQVGILLLPVHDEVVDDPSGFGEHQVVLGHPHFNLGYVVAQHRLESVQGG